MDTHCETGTEATGTTVQQVLHAEKGSHTISHEQGKYSVRNGGPSPQDISEHLCYFVTGFSPLGLQPGTLCP